MKLHWETLWAAELRRETRKKEQRLVVAAYYTWAKLCQDRYGEHPVEVRRKYGIVQALEE